MKICSVCKINKSEFEFCVSKNRKDGLNSICKLCANKRAQNKRKKNRDNLNKIIPDIKKCSMCKETKSSNSFGKNRSTHDGLAAECKECIKIRSKNRDKNKKKESDKKYRDSHPNALQNLIKWTKEHPDRVKEYRHNWYVDHRDDILGKNKQERNAKTPGQKEKDRLVIAVQLATQHNGKCLSDKCKTFKTKLDWECEIGHKWSAMLEDIRQGKWCPDCGGTKKHTLQDAKKLAEEHGGKCLSEEYINHNTLMKWECDKQHKWEATLKKILNGQWCQICCPRSKSQAVLEKIIREIYKTTNIKYNFRGFDWLVSDNNRKLEIDIFLLELKLAIEYDGKQHFQPIKFNKISDEQALCDFERRKHLDAIKNTLIPANQQDIKYFIRFNYKEKITKESVVARLVENNIPLAIDESLRFSDIYIPPIELKKQKEIFPEGIKKCSICKEIKMLQDFNVKESKCKLCQKEYNKIRYAAKPKIIKPHVMSEEEILRGRGLKKCNDCKEIKEICFFNKHQSKCKECQTIYNRQWYISKIGDNNVCFSK
jgi:hypothetical protein